MEGGQARSHLTIFLHQAAVEVTLSAAGCHRAKAGLPKVRRRRLPVWEAVPAPCRRSMEPLEELIAPTVGEHDRLDQHQPREAAGTVELGNDHGGGAHRVPDTHGPGERLPSTVATWAAYPDQSAGSALAGVAP